MARQIIEAEAEIMEEARKLAVSRMPNGFHQVSEKILSDGKQAVARGSAEMVDSAFVNAKRNVPDNATILQEQVTSDPRQEMLILEALDESKAKQQVSSSLIIKSVRLANRGRKGFLGFGAKPSQYEIEVTHPAKVEITFKRKAKIQLEISDGKVPSKGFCQMCGLRDSPAKISEKSVHFFCSPSCEEKYYKLSVAALLGSGFVINASGQDISGFLAQSKSLRDSNLATCWSCGRHISIIAKKCTSCGEEQELKP